MYEKQTLWSEGILDSIYKSDLLKNKDKLEEFLLQLEANAKIEEYSNEEYKIIGLPFYNQDERLYNFNEAFETLVSS